MPRYRRPHPLDSILGPPKPPHHPHLHHPEPGEQWLVNVDETHSLKEIAPSLVRMFGDLAEEGQAEIGEHAIAPTPEVDVVLRLAKSARGHTLLLVLAWDDDGASPTTSSFDALFPKAPVPAR